MNTVEVGILTLETERRVSRSFEYAAWYSEILVMPGAYKIMADLNYGCLHLLYVPVEGVIVDHYTGPNSKAEIGLRDYARIYLPKEWTSDEYPVKQALFTHPNLITKQLDIPPKYELDVDILHIFYWNREVLQHG